MELLDRVQVALRWFVEATSAAAKMRQLETEETKLERALRSAFLEQGRMFLAEFEGLRHMFREAVTPADWLPLFDEVARETFLLFWEPIQVGIAESMLIGGTATYATLAMDTAFDLDNPLATEYLRNRGAWAVTSINETTREYINTVVTQAADEGWSYNRTAKAIQDRYIDFAVGKPQQHIRSRAHLVAITETGQAYEMAGHVVARDLQRSGLPMEKRWLTVGDDKVSDGCRANEAEGWISLDQEFSSGHMTPLRFPGCRCTTLMRVMQ